MVPSALNALDRWPLSGVKRTLVLVRVTSVPDPLRTLRGRWRDPAYGAQAGASRVNGGALSAKRLLGKFLNMLTKRTRLVLCDLVRLTAAQPIYDPGSHADVVDRAARIALGPYDVAGRVEQLGARL
jgi:hypothetical protein